MAWHMAGNAMLDVARLVDRTRSYAANRTSHIARDMAHTMP